MSAAPGQAWQQHGLVEDFLRDRQRLLPLLDVQEDLIEQAFRRHGRTVARFLDIGAGDGAMSVLLRRVFPEAEAILVDYSDPMLARAERRVRRQIRRVPGPERDAPKDRRTARRRVRAIDGLQVGIERVSQKLAPARIDRATSRKSQGSYHG